MTRAGPPAARPRPAPSAPAAVLVTRPLPAGTLARLTRPGGATPLEVRLWDLDEPIPRRELLARVAGVCGLVCLLTDRVDREVFDAAGPALRVVSTVAVGYDHIEVPEATRRGILVTNTPGVLTETTADLTWALILAASRRLGEAMDHLRDGRWRTWRLLELAGMDVYGATLGVVGAGRIGRAVARRAAGFAMKVLYSSRRRRPEFEAATGAEFRPFDDLLREADVVSLHVPLTAKTRHLIGARELALMKPTAVLVNTSRGPVVDERALAGALARGHLFAAGLDVYETEPLPPGSPLRKLPNVVLLPHVGSATVRTRTRMAELAVDNLLEALAGRMPEAAVNPEAWTTP